MAIRWLPAVTVVLLLGGCGFENAPSANPSPQPRAMAKPAAFSHQPAVAQKPAAKPPQPAKPPERPAEKKPAAAAAPLTDDFGLPLVIVIEVPEVPKELWGPSPPIREPPAPKPPAPGPKP